MSPSIPVYPTPPGDDYVVAGPTIMLLLRITGKLRRLTAPILESQDIGLSPWMVLSILREFEKNGREAIRLVDLSNYLGVRPPSLTPVAKKLLARQLIERAPSMMDHRERRIRLTPIGRKVVDRLAQDQCQREQELLNIWSKEEQELAQELLGKLWHHLDALQYTPASLLPDD